jgi:hypothetical protein
MEVVRFAHPTCITLKTLAAITKSTRCYVYCVKLSTSPKKPLYGNVISRHTLTWIFATAPVAWRDVNDNQASFCSHLT